MTENPVDPEFGVRERRVHGVLITEIFGRADPGQRWVRAGGPTLTS